MAELERLHSHVLWAGIASKLMGFKTMFMTCFEIREKIMDVLAAISGNRVNYSMNRIGGVNRDIDDPAAILAMIEQLEGEMMKTVIPIFTTSSTARSRCAGIGVLTEEKAVSCGVVGPTARASGLGQDLRRAAPYAAYAELDFEVPVEQAGDVRARLFVRALEIIESCRFSTRRSPSCLPAKSTPAKRNSSSSPAPRPAALKRRAAKSCTASPGRKARATRPASTSARPPTPTCPPSAGWSMGARLADTPLIQASIDPCYSCTDR